MDGREYSGRSQGNYQGLDLVADMYVGGFPNFSRLAQNSGFREGFVGMYVSGFWYLFSLQHLLLKFMKYVTVYTLLFLRKSVQWIRSRCLILLSLNVFLVSVPDKINNSTFMFLCVSNV